MWFQHDWGHFITESVFHLVRVFENKEISMMVRYVTAVNSETKLVA